MHHRLLIVDDHAIVRKGFKEIIEKKIKNIAIDEAGSSQKAINKILKTKYDLIVLDITLPGRNGFELLEEVKKINPKIPVLILSMHSEEEYVTKAIKLGASGFLTKDSPPNELIKAIKSILQGKSYLSSVMTESIIQSMQKNDDENLKHKSLSNRELDVMCMLAKCQTVTKISELLNLSVNTVYTYRNRIFKKMNFNNNLELIQYAIKNHLIKE